MSSYIRPNNGFKVFGIKSESSPLTHLPMLSLRYGSDYKKLRGIERGERAKK